MEKRDSSTSSHEKDHPDPEPAFPVLGKDGVQTDKQLDISLTLPGMLGVHEEDELDPIEARSVKRKLDGRVLPLLMA
jgi:hypothetical protein